jgi:hypothetical protein
VGDDCSFHIFGMVGRTSKPTNELFNFFCFNVQVFSSDEMLLLVVGKT